MMGSWWTVEPLDSGVYWVWGMAMGELLLDEPVHVVRRESGARWVWEFGGGYATPFDEWVKDQGELRWLRIPEPVGGTPQ